MRFERSARHRLRVGRARSGGKSDSGAPGLRESAAKQPALAVPRREPVVLRPVTTESPPASVRLYLTLYTDVLRIRQTESRNARGGLPAETRRKLAHNYKMLLSEGASSGELLPLDPGFLAWLILNLGEAAFDRSAEAPQLPAAEVARRTADFALRSVLRDPARLDWVRGEAARLDGTP